MAERGEARGKVENIHGRCGEISPPAIYRGTTNCASSFEFQVYFTDMYYIVSSRILYQWKIRKHIYPLDTFPSTLQTASRNPQPSRLHTPLRHPPDIPQTPSRHPSDTQQTPPPPCHGQVLWFSVDKRVKMGKKRVKTEQKITFTPGEADPCPLASLNVKYMLYFFDYFP